MKPCAFRLVQSCLSILTASSNAIVSFFVEDRKGRFDNQDSALRPKAPQPVKLHENTHGTGRQDTNSLLKLLAACTSALKACFEPHTGPTKKYVTLVITAKGSEEDLD